jgi:type II secretory pathway pseudopilin PulG
MRRNKSGFSLMEAIVVTGIFLIITTSVLVSYPLFNERFELRRSLQSVALALRKAQAYGMAVKEFGTGTDNFPGYGIYFQTAVPNSYIFFADTNGDRQYSGASERIEEVQFSSRSRIADLCGNKESSPPGVCGLSSLTVVYLRPDPSVTIISGAATYIDGEITIRSLSGIQKRIYLWTSGQISVEK